MKWILQWRDRRGLFMLQAQFEGSRILCVALSVFSFLLFTSILDSFLNFLMSQK